VALSFDSWTSTNNISMLAINKKWVRLDIKIYFTCLDFIKIKGDYLGKNLASLVYKRAKKLSILYKIISLTRDNALNNKTYA
jgi:hypothetical protein